MPASVAETEEVVAPSMEPKLTSKPEEDLKARRLEAIKAKAFEIEKVARFAPRKEITSVNSQETLCCSCHNITCPYCLCRICTFL